MGKVREGDVHVFTYLFIIYLIISLLFLYVIYLSIG